MPTHEHAPIGVIGGGLAGLTASCTLAARGYEVVLFERNPWLGGKAAELAAEGFRFDMGPTILTLPSVLKRVFEEAGRNIDDYLDLVRLDPQWRCFFEDHSVLDLHQSQEAMRRALEEFAPGDGVAQGYDDFLSFSERLHRISDNYFFWRSIGSIKDMFDPRASMQASVLADVLRMKMGLRHRPQLHDQSILL